MITANGDCPPVARRQGAERLPVPGRRAGDHAHRRGSDRLRARGASLRLEDRSVAGRPDADHLHPRSSGPYRRRSRARRRTRHRGADASRRPGRAERHAARRGRQPEPRPTDRLLHPPSRRSDPGRRRGAVANPRRPAGGAYAGTYAGERLPVCRPAADPFCRRRAPGYPREGDLRQLGIQRGHRAGARQRGAHGRPGRRDDRLRSLPAMAERREWHAAHPCAQRRQLTSRRYGLTRGTPCSGARSRRTVLASRRDPMAAIAPGAPTQSKPEPTPMPTADRPGSSGRTAPPGPTLIDLLRDGAKRYGDRPALLIRPGFRTRIWSYRDLGDLAPRVARVLTDMGLERGDRVLIWGVNRPEWSIGFFGALFAGIVLVPLDVRSQPDFVAKIAQRTRAKLVLASTQTAPAAQALNLPVVLIESLPDRARGVDPLPTPQISASDLVEVVFTSGTTGEPKGAMLTHGNLMTNANALRAVFPFKPDERLLSILPLSHMFEQTCGLTAPFLAGASIVYPVSRQPAVLMRTFRDFRVTMLLIVPAGLKLLDSAIQRKVDAGGKRASFERLHRIARHLPRALKRLLFRPVISGFGGRFRTVAVGAGALEEDLANRWTNT